jgi:hypothetical protein
VKGLSSRVDGDPAGPKAAFCKRFGIGDRPPANPRRIHRRRLVTYPRPARLFNQRRRRISSRPRFPPSERTVF